MSLFDAYEPFALDELFGSSNPAQFELGLSTGTILDNGGGISEPAGGYGRLTINNTAATFNLASTDGGGVTTKTSKVAFTWPAAAGPWGTVTHWFLYDFANTRYVIHGPLALPKDVILGDIFRIPSGTMVLTVD
jgi:hypothetical protein